MLQKKEAKQVIATFGIPEDAIADLFKLLSNVEENAKLSFPPLDVPHHALAAELPDWEKK
jgi:hypothetical protein